MEAEFKSTQRFVPPFFDIFLNKWTNLAFCFKNVVFSHFNVYFQQY